MFIIYYNYFYLFILFYFIISNNNTYTFKIFYRQYLIINMRKFYSLILFNNLNNSETYYFNSWTKFEAKI